MLAIENLSLRFPGTPPDAPATLRHVSLTVAAGETVALVGESGSGKSVTALSILRLLRRSGVSYPTGEIRFRGQSLLPLPRPALNAIRGRDIGMVFQEPMTALNPLHRIAKQLTEAILLHRPLPPPALRQELETLLHTVGLSDPARILASYPHELSGGQRQRVIIAMAIANTPALLIADEPTTALDVTIQAQIVTLLQQLQAQSGMGMLLISHDLGMVRRLASRVYVMQQGEVVESGPCSTVFGQPQHPYTQQLLAAEALHGHPPPLPDSTASPLLTAEGVQVWFPVRRGWLGKPRQVVRAVDGVSLHIRPGETLGVVGESGSGKSTLGAALLRLTRTDGGTVVFNSQAVLSLPAPALRTLRRDMQIVFQDPYGALSPRMSVGDIVAEGLDVHEARLPKAAREARIATALSEVGLDPAARHRYPHAFSGGQRQRIAIARALILKPKFIVLDEPTSALDLSVQAEVVALLRGLQARYGLAYLFISHDLRVVRALSHRIAVMQAGQIVETGPAEDLFTRPQHPYTQQLLQAAFFRDTPTPKM
jgi:microcin C transport system ATP-binding protein